MRSRPQAWLALSLTVLAAAWALVLAKSSLARVDALTFAWLQVAIGMGLLLLIRRPGKRESGRQLPALARRDWVLLIAMGVCNFTIARATFLLALDTVSATTQSYVVNFTAIVTMGMSVLLLRERPTVVQIVGALVAIAGVRLFFGGEPTTDRATGVAWLILGVFALSVTNTAGRVLASTRHGGQVLSATQISRLSLWIGGAPLVLAGLGREAFALGAAHEFERVLSIGARDWAVLLLNATTSIAVGPMVFNYAFRVLRSYEASVVATSGLIYTAILSNLLSGEVLGGWQVLAIATMLLGIALTQLRRA